MLKILAGGGLLIALTGCAVAPGYDYGYGYGYGQPAYYGYEPAYGGVSVGIWGGGPDHYYGGHGYRDHRGSWPQGARGDHGGRGPGGHGGSGHGGGR
ncbi:MAG TPA: hypothetical protein VL689_07645 [Paraburkholderia sp.]|jgi:hypothetical protein|nr:hypothetical protein [Paraburkholderia sp.]